MSAGDISLRCVYGRERVRKDLHNRKKALPRPALNFRHQCVRLSVPAVLSCVSGNYRTYPMEAFRGARRVVMAPCRPVALSVCVYRRALSPLIKTTFALGGKTLTRVSYARSEERHSYAHINGLSIRVPRLKRAPTICIECVKCMMICSLTLIYPCN